MKLQVSDKNYLTVTFPVVVDDTKALARFNKKLSTLTLHVPVVAEKNIPWPHIIVVPKTLCMNPIYKLQHITVILFYCSRGKHSGWFFLSDWCRVFWCWDVTVKAGLIWLTLWFTRTLRLQWLLITCSDKNCVDGTIFLSAKVRLCTKDCVLSFHKKQHNHFQLHYQTKLHGCIEESMQ